MFTLIKNYLRPYWLSAVIAPLLMVTEVSMDLLQPFLLAHIIDKGIAVGNMTYVFHTAPWMLLCAIIGWGAGVGCTVFSARAGTFATADLRRYLLASINRMPLMILDRVGTGALLTRMTNDVIQIQQFIMMLLRVFVRSPMLAIGSLVMAALIDPMLALCIFVAMPIIGVCIYFIARASMEAFHHVQVELDGVHEHLRDNVAGYRTVKAFANQSVEIARFDFRNNHYLASAIKAWRIAALNVPTLILLNFSLVGILWLGAGKTRVGDLGIGQLAAFVTYASIAVGALGSLSNLINMHARASTAIEWVNPILIAVDNRNGGASPVARSINRSAESTLPEILLSVRNLAFGYQADHLVLSAIDIDINAGEKIALLGLPGTGKSTLLNLLAGLYPPTAGEINGSLFDKNTNETSHQIALVSQTPSFIRGTIAENLTLGRAASQAQIEAACRIAQIHDFIVQLPDGYNTTLDYQSSRLSGGQRQRLSIARALLLKPKLLLLDDISSALDQQTERELFAALNDALVDSAWLVVSHKAEGLAQMDRVLVLDEGRIHIRSVKEMNI